MTGYDGGSSAILTIGKKKKNAPILLKMGKARREVLPG
jgi:hypothetical protein